MHSFLLLGFITAAVASAYGPRRVAIEAEMAKVTPGPRVQDLEVRDGGPDAISLAKVLLTAIPASLRQIAATNLPAVSSILWSEFLDNNRPEWFSELPWDIQSYLIQEFGPSTAVIPPSVPASATATSTESSGTEGFSTTASTQQSSQASSLESIGTTQSAASSSPGSTLQTSARSSHRSSYSSSLSNQVAQPTASSLSSTSTSPATAATASPDSSLSRTQKIGIGIGVPLAIASITAALLGCCFLLRRRRRQRTTGSIPPSSPGFIPRFAFQEKPLYENLDQQHPLHRSGDQSQVHVGVHDLGHSDWDDDVVDYGYGHNDASSSAPRLDIPAPIVTPSLYHTHSSNRARGKRTSYQSLQSVTEVSEPDEIAIESPILGRGRNSYGSSGQLSNMQQSRGVGGVIAPVPPPPIPAATQIKRKPLPTTNSSSSGESSGSGSGSSGSGIRSTKELRQDSAADLASQTLLRQTMGPTISTTQRHSPPRQHQRNSSQSQAVPISPISPISPTSPLNPFIHNHGPPGYNNTSHITALADEQPTFRYPKPKSTNPFTNSPTYIEDYGPEYHHDGYLEDFENNGLYGGNVNLSRYPEPEPKARGGGIEWPLKNGNGGTRHKRNKSPLWDRVYEG